MLYMGSVSHRHKLRDVYPCHLSVSGDRNQSSVVLSFLYIFQITMPTFPVVVKIGHAHSGMGKVRAYARGQCGTLVCESIRSVCYRHDATRLPVSQ